MLGAIIGDIVGSRFEFDNIRTKDFEFFASDCEPTDDSIMTAAVAAAILESAGNISALPQSAVKQMRRLGALYPHPMGGYGYRFGQWLTSPDPRPYRSFGNGAAMRVSPCGYAASSVEEAKAFSYAVTSVTHDHPEGIKGAEAAAVAIFLARTGYGMDEIRGYMNDNYYKTDRTLDEIRKSNGFDETCQGTLPTALEAFFESTGFEDAVRCAVSVGGDSDTIAAITGGIAGAYYGIPDGIRTRALSLLPEDLRVIVKEFEEKYGVR